MKPGERPADNTFEILPGETGEKEYSIRSYSSLAFNVNFDDMFVIGN